MLEADPAVIEQRVLFATVGIVSRVYHVQHPLAETYFSQFATFLVIFDSMLGDIILF